MTLNTSYGCLWNTQQIIIVSNEVWFSHQVSHTTAAAAHNACDIRTKTGRTDHFPYQSLAVSTRRFTLQIASEIN